MNRQALPLTLTCGDVGLARTSLRQMGPGKLDRARLRRPPRVLVGNSSCRVRSKRDEPALDGIGSQPGVVLL